MLIDVFLIWDGHRATARTVHEKCSYAGETKGLFKRIQLRESFLPRLDQYEAEGSAALPILYTTKDAAHDELYRVNTRDHPILPGGTGPSRTDLNGDRNGGRHASAPSPRASISGAIVHTAAPAPHLGMESATEPAVRKRVSPSRL